MDKIGTIKARKRSVSEKASDLAIIKRVQRGDRSAFDLLVIKYQHRIIKLIMRYVNDPSEALDVAQETFIKAYRASTSFRRDSAFYTWLYRIAINTAKNHCASAGRRPTYYDLFSEGAEHSEIFAKLNDIDTPEAVTLSEEIQQTISNTISDLPEELRTTILFREVDGMSYEEIAQSMDCPIGTVRSRIYRARATIEKSLKPLL